MYAVRLLPLLARDKFVPGSVTPIANLCDDWFRNDPSPASFVFRSIFKDLKAFDWDDEQGIETSNLRPS